MDVNRVKKTVLVTGGGGFIGSRPVHALLGRKCRVKVLDVQSGGLKGEGEAGPNLEMIGVGSDELRGGIANKGLYCWPR